MTGHSKEPWRVQHPHAGMRGWEIADSSGLNQVSQDVTEANARRIVACVNACEGLDLEMLERFGLGSALGHEVYRITEQRDELLAALEDAATSLETIQLRSFGEDSFLDSKPEMRSYAGSRASVVRAAITKAKGGADITKNTGETK